MTTKILNDVDIFTLPVDAIVNPVNCVGVMGKGLALAFKRRYPENFTSYAAACKGHLLRPGGILVHDNVEGPPRYIINLATKHEWHQPSKIDWVAEGTRSMMIWAQDNHISSIACPALGAGLGQLPWEPVRDTILGIVKNYPDIEFTLIAPGEPIVRRSFKTYPTKGTP